MRKKIKYQGGLTRMLCRQQAAKNKEIFGKNVLLPKQLLTFKNNSIDFDVISFSGSANFEDQVLSIYSFLYTAGTPVKWTIYSDKTYTKEQKHALQKQFPFVEVADWDVYDFYKGDKHINEYLSVCAMAKKINLIVGHQYRRQTIYLDSDVIFYKNFTHYINGPFLKTGLWYASDALGDVTEYFSLPRDSMYPLNSGLLILNDTFDRSDISVYFENLKGTYGYFSEQSSFEYALRKQGAHMLDPRQFIIDSADQFDFAMKYFPEDIAMRHYTSPVRHKMWQLGWKWHFAK